MTTDPHLIRRSQNRAPLSEREIARAMRSFRSEFKDHYPPELLCGLVGAFGPMQAFLGHCVELGLLAEKEAPQEPQKLLSATPSRRSKLRRQARQLWDRKQVTDD